MTNIPDHNLEYVYTKKSFKKDMWTIFIIWLIMRLIRIALSLTVGIMAFGAVPLALLLWGSGLCFGLGIARIMVYRKSVKINDLQKTVERNASKQK